jgi:hypothetical protein
MATKFEDAKKELLNPELSKEEQKLFNEIEKYIDDEIKRLFDNRNVEIAGDIFEFAWHPREDHHIEIKGSRMKILSDKLKKTYEDAGWKVDVVGEKDAIPRARNYYLTGKK